MSLAKVIGSVAVRLVIKAGNPVVRELIPPLDHRLTRHPQQPGRARNTGTISMMRALHTTR